MRRLTSSIQRWTPFLHLQRRRIFPFPVHLNSLHFASLHTSPLHSLHPLHPLHSLHPTPPHSTHYTTLTSLKVTTGLHSLLYLPHATSNSNSPSQPCMPPPAPSRTPPSSTRALSSSRLAPVVPVPVSVRPSSPPPRQHLVACATEATLMHAAQHSG
jgi:hypothetical protein